MDLPFRATSVSRRIHKSVSRPKDQAQQMLPEGAERGRYRGHYQIAAQCISNTVEILYNRRKDFGAATLPMFALEPCTERHCVLNNDTRQLVVTNNRARLYLGRFTQYTRIHFDCSDYGG